MALTYEVGYDYISKIGNKEINFRQWNAKDEKNYLQLLERESKVAGTINEKIIFDTLLLPCIKNKKVFLSKAQQKKLIIDIRSESISEFLEDTHVCKHCNEESSIKVPLADVVKYTESSYAPISVQNLVFNMGEIKDFIRSNKLDINKGVIEYVFSDFLLHVMSIEIDGVVEDKFKQKELVDFFETIPTRIFDEVFEKYQTMVDSIEIKHNFICPNCNTEDSIEFPNVPNLLWA